MSDKRYKNTFEFWHKGKIDLGIKLESERLICKECKSYDLDVMKLSVRPKNGDATLTFYCMDCDNIFTEEYPIISRRQVEQSETNSNNIDDLLKNNLQFDNL